MITQSPKPSTARRGNPHQASRGAAVRRAKLALADAIDLKLSYDREAAELALLAKVMGCSVDSARARLTSATLEQLERWTRAVEGMTQGMEQRE